MNVISFLYDVCRARYSLLISRNKPQTCGQYTLLEQSLFSNCQHFSFVLRYYKTHLSKTFLSPMLLSLFIDKSLRGPQGTLHSRRLLSVLQVLSTPSSKLAQLNFYNYKLYTMAFVVIYAYFAPHFEPFGRQLKRSTYSPKHIVWSATAILCSTLSLFNQLTVTNFGNNALPEFLDVLIEWETTI